MNFARVKCWIRAAIPEAWLKPVQRRFFRVRWGGDYASWAEAKQASRGYDAPTILEKVVQATRSVCEGRAAFERDGVTFSTPMAQEDVLEAVRRGARRIGQPVGVLDFGGSLGSVYGQNRRWLGAEVLRRWVVVEQPSFVAAGRREFEDERLRFYGTIEEAMRDDSPEVLILSGVLPYVEDPHGLLNELLRRRFEVVAVLRTGFVEGTADRLTVQKVPRNIYAASYPCWFFSRRRLLRHFEADYVVRSERAVDEGECDGVEFRNFVFERAP